MDSADSGRVGHEHPIPESVAVDLGVGTDSARDSTEGGQPAAGLLVLGPTARVVAGPARGVQETALAATDARVILPLSA